MPQSYQTQAGAGGKKDQEPTIVIGIDFGTTYSGVAWTTSSRPGHINIITNWNAVKNHCSDKEKVPSAIYYNDKGEISWGYSIPEKESSHKLEWFKLCLLDEDDIPRDIRDAVQIQAARKALKEANKSAVEVISDYLRELWKHSIANIKRAIGPQLVDISKFKVVVTLPAIWPAYAQIRMEESIKKAGILDARTAGATILEFLSEPEAAALATISDMGAYSKTTMEVGDHFVVCDAGGGTVDVITYTVIKTNPIRVKESVKGDGKLCGATFLDGMFLTTLRNKLDKISPDAWQILERNGALSRLIHNDWENGIKPQFRNTDQHWVLLMPGSIGSRKRSHDQFRFSDIKLTATDVQKIFKPIVAEIETLVTDQAKTVKREHKKEPKFLVLVGGFGRQPFLYTRLQDQLNRKKSQKERTEVLQGSGAEPWTAVCRGAVIRGLELSDNRTESTGETIPVGRSVERGFCRDISEPVTEIHETFYYSTETIPSKRRDETVKKLCKVRWSIVPDFNSLPIWVNPIGVTYRRISFDIKMTSNGVTLDFEIIHNNQVVVSKKIGIDYDRSGSTVD
ncbi:HSP70 family [Trichoderma chlorosporum]